MSIWARVMRYITHFIYLCIVLMIIGAGLLWLISEPMFNLKEVQVTNTQGDNLQYIPRSSIQEALNDHDLGGNFFTLNLDQVATHIRQIPWVDGVQVRRVWPDAVMVIVHERQPFAHWGANQLMDTNGQVFVPSASKVSIDPNLPQLSGPEGSELYVMQAFKLLEQDLQKVHLQVIKIVLSNRYDWQVTLNNGLELIIGRDSNIDQLGSNQLSQSFIKKVALFVDTWPILEQKMNTASIKSVDLRYTNGYALQFKPLLNSKVEK